MIKTVKLSLSLLWTGLKAICSVFYEGQSSMWRGASPGMRHLKGSSLSKTVCKFSICTETRMTSIQAAYMCIYIAFSTFSLSSFLAYIHSLTVFKSTHRQFFLSSTHSSISLNAHTPVDFIMEHTTPFDRHLFASPFPAAIWNNCTYVNWCHVPTQPRTTPQTALETLPLNVELIDRRLNMMFFVSVCRVSVPG